MFNFGNPKNRKKLSAAVIILVVLAMLGTTLAGSIAMFLN